ELGQDVDLMDLAEMSGDFLLPTAYKERPPKVQAMVDRFLAADGVVFVVPEYNGSYPGAVKLFIDMLPYPQGFDRRACAFVGLAAGEFRGLRAVEHLQQVAGYRMAHIYPRRCFIGRSYSQFDEDGRIKDPELDIRLKDQARGFVEFIERVGSPVEAE
ncbi:MAG: NAD(P)H-dependent oxidoreductase, partial [Gemmatimonadetes bacterium]|nr:NAD(P)H-dependent oxidoreductase [Gemmatimonadota bacterium]